MSVKVSIQAIALTPGSQIGIPHLSWQDFERLLTDLGEKRNTRVTYYRGMLEIVSPLALHERFHRIIGDYVLSDRGYAETSISPTFPNLAILELIPQLVQKAIDRETSRMLRELRTKFRQSEP